MCIRDRIVATDPLAIGGASYSLRNRMKVWEADIKYYANYIFDQGLQVGMPYNIYGDSITPAEVHLDETVYEAAGRLFEGREEREKENIREWLRILAAEIPRFKRVAFDLEMYTEEELRVPLATQATDPITAVSFRGSDGLKKVLLLDMGDGINLKHFEGKEFEVEIFKDERKLIERALQILQGYPFIITFNGDNFDLPYLYRRALKLSIPSDQVPINVGRQDARVKWGVHLDLYRFFFNKSIRSYAFQDRYPDISLDMIGRALIGLGKLVSDTPISRMKAEELAEYCFRDSEITYQLTSFGDDLVMRLITIIGKISNMILDDVCRLSVSNWIKNRLIVMHRKANYLIPLKEEIRGKRGQRYSEPITKGKKYIGAVVVEPRPGVFFGVQVLDFNSLYPSIIKEWNISYETVNCSHPECMGNKVPGTGNWVCTKKRGIVSEFVGSIRDIRVEVFKKLAKRKDLDPERRNYYNVVQNAMKVIINASYGVFGSETFSFYYLPAAESITMIGRHFFNKTIEKCKELGIDLIYGDTDSLFLYRPKREQMEELMRWVEEQFQLELEIDKVYRYVAFSSRKKNYFGILEDGLIDVKGLVGKKKNTPGIIRKAFYEALEALRSVKDEEEFEKAKEKVKDIIKEAEERIRRREVPLEELAISVTLGKGLQTYVKTTPQHVKAAVQLEKELGKKVLPGETIRFIKTRDKTGVKPLELSEPSDVDTKKYIELLRSTFEQLLDALGLEMEKERIGGYTTTLESFM